MVFIKSTKSLNSLGNGIDRDSAARLVMPKFGAGDF